jgi:hypothetical protein
MRWARVKATAESALIAAVNAVCWRPAFIDAELSLAPTLAHRLLKLVLGLLISLADLYVAGTDLGNAMLQATVDGIRGRIVENREIRELARRFADQGTTLLEKTNG